MWFIADGRLIRGCVDLPVGRSGTVTRKMSFATAGRHVIQAGYLGDAQFATAASNKINQTIKRKPRGK